MKKIYDCVAVGGGPASFFAMIQLKTIRPETTILILEKQHRPLEKIYVSGGGRCNLTHACFDPKELSSFYPRGQKELRGAFYHFQPSDTMAWFEDQGVLLKTEPDGRVFPKSNQAESVANALLQAAEKLKIDVWLEASVMQVEQNEDGFDILLKDNREITTRKILFGSGGNRKALKIVNTMGITIIPPVPSLFSLLIDHPILTSCAGTPLQSVKLRLENMPYEELGSMMITHEGLSGPAVLKLSAFAARDLFEKNYQHPLLIDWIPNHSKEEVLIKLQKQKEAHPKKKISGDAIFSEIPKKIWQALFQETNNDETMQWSNFSKAKMQAFVQLLKETRLSIDGKSTNKQEFVTCGGVQLKSVDFRTMQSKELNGVFFAGEVLDIDGLTGGFNLQNTWTTGWISGNGIAKQLEMR